MISFINENIVALTFFCIVLALSIALVVKGDFAELRRVAYKLILGAEKIIEGSNKGQERFNFVLAQLYFMYFPKWLKIFVSQDMLEGYLQDWFDDVKDYLDDGKFNKSV